MNAKPRSERDKLVQVVHNFFSKAAQIIAQSRLVPVPESSGKVNKWFNLEIDELERVRDDLRPWRQGSAQVQTQLGAGGAADDAPPPLTLPPLVIEVVVDPRDLVQGQALVLRDAKGRGWNCAADTAGPGAAPAAAMPPKEVVVERWVVDLLPNEVADPDAELPVVYKRAIVAMRALFTLVRLMPSWQLRQRLVRQKLATVPLKMGVRVFSGHRPISSRGRIGLSRPIVPEPPQDVLKTHQLAPVDTPAGTLAVNVSYRANVAFDVEDAEKVLAQQFLDLDLKPQVGGARETGAVAGSAPSDSQFHASVPGSVSSVHSNIHGSVHSNIHGSVHSNIHGSVQSNIHGSVQSSQGIARRPTFSFTRPFRDPDANHSTASLAGSAVSTASVANSSFPPSSLPNSSLPNSSLPTSLPNSSLPNSSTPEPHHHTTPVSAFGRTPSTSSLSRTAPQSVPVPVPWRSQSPMVQTAPITPTTQAAGTPAPGTPAPGTPAPGTPASVAPPGSASSSYSRRFSSSFASRHSAFVARSSESRVRPSSIHSGSASASIASTSASFAGSLEPGSGLYVAHEDAGDFVRFVDDTQRRASSAFRGPRAAHPTSVDSSLQRFQNLRSSHSQLSDSISASTTLRPSPSRTPPAAKPAPSALGSIASGGSGSGSDKSTLRRRSSGRARLSFYGGAADDSHDNDHDSDSRDDHELLFAMSDMHE